MFSIVNEPKLIACLLVLLSLACDASPPPRQSASGAASAEPFRCGRLSLVPASERQGFVDRPAEEWPQIVLTNRASFEGSSGLNGASAFLLRSSASEETWIASARHLIGRMGGVQPSLIEVAADVGRFNARLERWRVHPRTQPNRFVDANALATSAVFGDWVLLSVERQDSLPANPVMLASRKARVGDAITLVGCPYSERACTQNLYRGHVLEEVDNGFTFDVTPHVNIRGFSGAPILNEDGNVVGVLHRTVPEARNEDGTHRIAVADDGLLRSCGR